RRRGAEKKGAAKLRRGGRGRRGRRGRTKGGAYALRRRRLRCRFRLRLLGRCGKRRLGREPVAPLRQGGRRRVFVLPVAALERAPEPPQRRAAARLVPRLVQRRRHRADDEGETRDVDPEDEHEDEAEDAAEAAEAALPFDV